MKHSQTILITGATSGLGLSLTVKSLLDGHKVLAGTRRPEALRRAVSVLSPEAIARLKVFRLDYNSPIDREEIVDYIKLTGQIDVLVNNAGKTQFGPLECLSEAEIRSSFEVNVFGPVLLTRDLTPLLRKNNGKVFNILVSKKILQSKGPTGVFSSSKMAFEAFIKTYASDFQDEGIQVCNIYPPSLSGTFFKNISWPLSGVGLFDGAAYRAREFKSYLQKIYLQKKTSNPDEVALTILRYINSNEIPQTLKMRSDRPKLRKKEKMQRVPFLRNYLGALK